MASSSARNSWFYIYGNSTDCPTNYNPPYATYTNTVRGCIFLDSNGNGTYQNTIDPLIIVSEGTTAALTSGAAINETLRFTTDDVDGWGNGNDGIYFDLNGNGTYSATMDIAIPISAAASASATNNDFVTADFRWTRVVPTVFLDTERYGTSENRFNPAHDDRIVGGQILNAINITAADNAELLSSLAAPASPPPPAPANPIPRIKRP